MAQAAYNFVPFGKGHAEIVLTDTPEIADNSESARFSGWFDLTYRTLTPTFIRAGRGLPEFVPGNAGSPNTPPADFFHHGDGTPVLPGTALRGMVRTVFEVLTYSRVSAVSRRHLLFRRVGEGDPLLSPLYRKQFGEQAGEGLVGGILRERPDGSFVLQVAKVPDAPQGIALVPVVDSNLPAPLLVGTTRDPANAGERRRDDRFRRDRNDREPEVFDVGPRPRIPPHLNNKRACRITLPAGEALRFQGDIDLPAARLRAIAPYDKANVEGDPQPDTNDAWLVIPGPDVTPREWYPAVLVPGPESEELAVSPEVYADYEDWARRTHGARFFDSRPTGMPRRLRDGEPAFALRDPKDPSRILALGAAMMLHLPFGTTIADLAARFFGDATPATDFADAVFGRGGDNPVKSRVAFEDAVCQTADPFLERDPARSLRIADALAAPKPTAAPLYLLPSGSATHFDSEGAELRGTKFYWHRSPESVGCSLGRDVGGPLGATRVRLRPVRANVEFAGRVRFTDLTLAELGALYAALHLPEGLAYHIGWGKPMGLGSLEIQPEDDQAALTATLVDPATRYASLAPTAGITSPEETEATLRRAYWEFVNTVRRHETPNPKGLSLWRSDRLRILAALLDFEQRPPDAETRTAPLGSPQWTRREPLITARELAQEEGIEPPRDIFRSDNAAPPKPSRPTVEKDDNDGRPLPDLIPKVGAVYPGVIVSRSYGMLGDVDLEAPAGTVRITGQYIGMGEAGTRAKFKVLKVNGTGQIKEIRRA